MIFSAEYVDSIKFVDIALDALSPIYLINANAVHATVKDTVVYTQQHEQKCVSLRAVSDITTFDTVRWYKLVDTTKIPVAYGLNTTVCLDSSTTFLIAMRDSVIGCAGVEWSWDTVRIWVRDTVLGITETAAPKFALYPNPAQDELTISPTFEEPYNFSIADELGRICVSGIARKEKQLSIAHLAPGAYLVRVDGGVRRMVKR